MQKSAFPMLHLTQFDSACIDGDFLKPKIIQGPDQAIYQTLPMGSFFEEKVPFQLILIKNDS